MGHRISHIALGAAVVATPFGVWTSTALAQNYTIQSLSPATASAGTFTTGNSTVTLTMSPGGSFSPTGYQRSATAPSYTVTVKCANHAGGTCSTTHSFVLVMKDSSSTTTGRLSPLQNFTMGSSGFTVS